MSDTLDANALAHAAHVAEPELGAYTPDHDGAGNGNGNGDTDFAALDRMARVLTASGDYRVLRRFTPRREYRAKPGVATRTALFVDVEATGLDTANDAIIEFAAVPFTFDPATGHVHDVREPFVAFEDPGRPIPEDVVALTGITDDMVRGHRIDDARVEALLGDVVLVIAHNAAFDRPLVERRFPSFARLHWACSHAEVPWAQLGCRGSKLDYLLFQRCAEFFDGHRADEDCCAAIHVLATPHVDGTVPFRLLLESARTPTERVWALDTPIAIKDALKARRYRWFPGDARRQKSWYRDCSPAEAAAEVAWLAEVAYAGRAPGHKTERFTARERYSARM